MLPRGEAHSSLGVCWAADSSSARGDSKVVDSVCVVKELEVALDVAAVFL